MNVKNGLLPLTINREIAYRQLFTKTISFIRQDSERYNLSCGPGIFINSFGNRHGYALFVCSDFFYVFLKLGE